MAKLINIGFGNVVNSQKIVAVVNPDAAPVKRMVQRVKGANSLVEEDGREYFFRTREEFEEMIRQDQLIEYAQYVENYYGTPKAYVEEQLSQGRDVILEIEIQGARKIKKKFPEAVLVFVTAPSMEVLRERLVGRGTETAEVIHQRLARAAQEAEGVDEYDYVLVNDQLDEAVDRLHGIIQSEHFSMKRNLDFIHEIQAQAARFTEE